jgi:hypothetical protein
VGKIRELIAAARGAKPGAKAKASTVQRCLDDLVARGVVRTCQITSGRANGHAKTFDGFTVGEHAEYTAERIASGQAEWEDPHDV